MEMKLDVEANFGNKLAHNFLQAIQTMPATKKGNISLIFTNKDVSAYFQCAKIPLIYLNTPGLLQWAKRDQFSVQKFDVYLHKMSLLSVHK